MIYAVKIKTAKKVTFFKILISYY